MSITNVTLSGGTPQVPEVRSLRKGTRLDREVQKILPTLTHNRSLLCYCGPGTGKTNAAVNAIVPFAKENGYPVLYVSSRVALNTQTKRSLLQVLGQENLLSELTEEGLQKHEDFDGVSVITYHRLYSLMRSDPERLKQFVMDEQEYLRMIQDTKQLVTKTKEHKLGNTAVAFSQSSQLVNDVEFWRWMGANYPKNLGNSFLIQQTAIDHSRWLTYTVQTQKLISEFMRRGSAYLIAEHKKSWVRSTEGVQGKPRSVAEWCPWQAE